MHPESLSEDHLIRPDWPAPARVRTLVTTRNGGVSSGAYAGHEGGGLNLGTRCCDDADAVAHNRAMLRRLCPSEPVWLHQVHGQRAVDAASNDAEPEADAAFTRRTGIVCAIQTADCMAILLCDQAGTVVAAAHAGWRGLATGVIEATVAAMDVAPSRLLAYLGPAIGPDAFEVGDDVLTAFTAHDPEARHCFRPLPITVPGKWLCDLEALARQRLQALGITQIYGSGRCTVSEPQQFYSFRRDRVTGRMAALIWLE